MIFQFPIYVETRVQLPDIFGNGGVWLKYIWNRKIRGMELESQPVLDGWFHGDFTHHFSMEMIWKHLTETTKKQMVVWGTQGSLTPFQWTNPWLFGSWDDPTWGVPGFWESYQGVEFIKFAQLGLYRGFYLEDSSQLCG